VVTTFVILLVAAAFPVQATTVVQWNGQNCTGNFSYNNNWNWNSGTGGWPNGFGNELHFNTKASCQTSMFDDESGWLTFDNIIYDPSFPNSDPLTGNGNGIDFNQKIENDSSYPQSFGIPTSGARNGSGDIELNAVNGDLTISANVYNDNNKPFYAYGSSSVMLTVGIGLSGNNTVSFTQAGGAGSGYGKTKLTAAQSWGDSSHGVNVNVGEFWFDSGGSLASSSVPITVGLSDANTAKLWLSVLTGGQTLANNITVNNQSSSPVEKDVGGLNTSGTSTFTGTMTLNGQVNLSAATGGTVAFNGVISGSQNVVVNGYQLPFSGIITMGAANTYSGNTFISGGTLQFNSGGSAASSPNFYLGETSGSQTATLTLGATGGGQTINNAITVRSGSSGTKTISGLATSSSSTLGGNISLSDNLTVSSASGGNLNLNGVISGSSYGLTKTGSGTVTLGNANTYTGNTTISVGTLALSGSGSIANTPQISLATGASFDVSAVTPGGYSLNSSGTLALNINKTGSTLTQGQVVLGAKNLTFGGALTVTASGSTLAAGDSFNLITTTGTRSGWGSSSTVPALASGISWDTNKLATTGVLDIYTFTSTALTLSTPMNTNAVISSSKLLNHASSARGTPAVTAATTPGHGTASVSSGTLTYSPAANYTGSDSFMITFQDGHGWQTNVVNVTVGSGTGTSANVLSSGVVGSNFQVNFAGIPGYTYTVETNSVANGSGWIKWGNITAASNGAMQVVDPLGSSSLFYRTVWPSY
jgi:autotransporter-associated beta strand protein